MSDNGGGAGGEESFVGDAPEVVPGWIRIKLADDSDALQTGTFTRGSFDSGNAALDRVVAEVGATEVRRVFRDGGRFAERRRRYGLHLWYDIRIPDDMPVSRAGAEFASLSGVAYAEPIYRMHRLDAVSVPAEAVYEPPALHGEETMPFNDPRLGEQWHYHNDGSIDKTKAGSDINLFEGWKTTAGSPAVIVAVTDSGVQFDHEDLAANMWVNEAELNGEPGVDDDGNGYVDDLYGWNFVDDSGTIVPEDHGTHVAGTVAAVNNNGIGVCGVAGGTGNGDGARIMSMQIFVGDESVSDSDADCFVYAADNGAVISQNSWSWTLLSHLPRAYDEAFDYFIENAGMDDTDGDGINDVQTGPMKGGIIICAAGNSGGRIEYPAADSRTVAVTAMGAAYNLEPYSNRGAEADIMAPGGVKAANGKRRVLSTAADNDYKTMYGTSMACPHVSGVAALIIAEYGGEGFTAEQCRERLLQAYRPVGGLADDGDADLGVLGVGLLDAGAAFATDPQTPPEAVRFGSAETSGSTVLVPWTVPADGNGNAVAQFVVEYVSDGGEAGGGTVRNLYDVGQTMVYSFEGTYNTDYDITVSCIDRFGNVSPEATASVSVGGFENRPPELSSEKMQDVSIDDIGEAHAVTVTVSPCFTDPDLEYGDELSYSAVSADEEVAGVGMEGDVLTIRPLARGTSLVTVTATDLAGASVSASFYVTVAGGSSSVGGGDGLAVSPNPATDVVSIRTGGMEGTVAFRVYDAAARLVMDVHLATENGIAELDVSRLSPGVYSLAAEAEGRVLHGTFVKK